MKKHFIFLLTIVLINCNGFVDEGQFIDDEGNRIVYSHNKISGIWSFKTFDRSKKLRTIKTGIVINKMFQDKWLLTDSLGNVYGFENYKNGKLEGESIFWDSIYKHVEIYQNGVEIEVSVYDTVKNVLINYVKNNKSYLFNVASQKISLIMLYDPEKDNSLKLEFDSLGKIIFCNCPATFLSKADSLLLSKDYPNWQDQMKVWNVSKQGEFPGYR